MSWLSKGLRKVGRVGLPILGAALGGPFGGLAAEALAGAVGGGKQKLKAVPNLNIGDDFTPTVTPAGGGGRDWMGGLRKVGGAAMSAAPLVMGGLAMREGHQNDKRARRLNDEQLQFARQGYGERAGLRTLGRDLMLDQSQPDLSHIYANSSNPFSRRAS